MSVGDINVKLGLDTSAFSAGLAKAKVEALALGGSFDGIGKSLDKLGVGGGSLSSLGKGISEIATTSNLAAVGLAAIGVAAVAAGAQLAKMAADYQSAMAKVAATTGASNQQLKDMQDMMYQNAAQGSRLSMTQQAGIAGGLGAAGLIGPNTSMKEQLDLLKLTEKAMVALEAPTDDAISLFSQLQVRYGATPEMMSKASSSIAQMADDTSATNAEIITATTTMDRLAGTVKMSIPEMVAMASATKSFGIEAVEVGTQWGSLVKNLSSKSQETATAYEQLGLSQQEWLDALQESKNTGSNAPVLRFLRQLDGALQKSDKSAAQSMQLFGTYGMRIGGSIGQIITKYEDLLVSSQKAYDENVRLEQEYERITNTMNSMMDAISAKFSAIGTKIGTVLLKPIQDATYQFDQFLGKVMQGDFAGAWKGMYDAVLGYDWVGAGISIASMIGSGLAGLASFAANAVVQLGASLLTFDWLGAGRSIADQILNGLSNIGNMARNAIGDVSSWVNSGGAKSAGENLGNWIINGLQSVFSAGVDLYSWLKTNLTMDKVSGLVREAFNMGGELVKIGVQAGTDFISGISKAVTDSAGNYFNGVMTAARQLVTDIKGLGVEIAKTGINWVNEAANGVLAALSSKLQPILDVINRATGTNYTVPTSTGYTTQAGDISGASGKVFDSLGRLITAANPLSNTSKIEKLRTSGLSAFQGDPDSVMEMLAAQGVPFDQAYQQALSVLNGSGTYGKDWAKQIYDMSSYMSTPGSMSGLTGMQGLTNISGAYKGGTTASTTSTSGAAAASNLEKQWGGGVVPVFVTNWEGGAGGVTAGGTKIAGVNSYGQTVDANGLPVGKFDASKINTSGPGIGMVSTGASSKSSYANRLEIDTCEIDSFGMTPGLGLELANSGAWRPNAGAASQKLAAEIGYGGDYAEPSQYGAILGGLNSAIKTSATTQTTTANKVAGITVGAATKATGITIGGMNQAAYSFQAGTGVAAKTMEASALNAKIIQEDGAYSCFNIWGEGSQGLKDDCAAGGASIMQASTVAGGTIAASGTHVADSTVKMSTSLANGSKSIESAGASLQKNVETAMGSLLSQGSAFLASTFGGLYTGIGMGGGSTSTAGLPRTGAWGGTSISGGGAWVGTLSTGGTNNPALGQVSWGGTAASQAARSGSSGSFGSVRWFADGGVINQPQIVGVGEAGPEAIVPIDQMPGMVSKIMGGSVGGGSMVHTTINIDGRKLADAVGPAVIKRVQQNAGLHVR